MASYENMDIRLIVMESGLTYKAIAERIGVSAEYLSRCMRHPLSREMYFRIVAAWQALRLVSVE